MVCPLLISRYMMQYSLYSVFQYLFDFILPYHGFKSSTPPCHPHILKPSTAAQFSSVFANSAQSDKRSSAYQDMGQLTSSFLSTYASILGTVAPHKVMRPRPKSEPWLNDTTHGARQECRGAECRWKKVKLHVSYEVLKESWRKYQKNWQSWKNKIFFLILFPYILTNHVFFLKLLTWF